MKRKIIITVLSAGLLSMGARADVTNTIDSTAMTLGYMSVFNLPIPDGDGEFQFGSDWGVGDLSATYNEAGTEVTMVPNSIADADEYWYIGGGGPGAPGNKIMEASLYNEVTGDLAGERLIFTGNVSSMTLSNSHSVIAYIRNFAPDYSSFTEATVSITTTGVFSVSMNLGLFETENHVQYGIQMRGVNVWATDLDPFGSIVVGAIEDTQPPTPDPMQFAVPPYPTGDSSVSMTATNATDTFSDVEYYFTCVTGDGHDSGWQSSPTYEDTGLTPDTYYEYTVKARDTSPSQNETAESPAAYVITDFFDVDAPTPDPMAFGELPMAIGPVSIRMVATNATDASGVQYYFTCTSGGGNDSGWQSSPIYVDTGLDPNTQYTYTVIASDLSSNTNTTQASAPASATTPVLLKWMDNSLTSYTGDTMQTPTRIALGVDSLEYSVTSTTAAVSFDNTGAIFGEGTGYFGRNVLRTSADDYDKSSFEAYATITFDGTTDQAAFIGMGQGIIAAEVPGNWGVPELALGGVNGVVAEIKTSLSNGDKVSKLHKIVDGSIATNSVTDPMPDSGTFRIKLVYDAGANTVNASVDTSYTGGEFVADQDLGTLDTTGTGSTNMWYGAPVRVYVGGGEGTVVKDLVIIPTEIHIDAYSTQVPGGGMVIFWQSEADQIYNLEYTTNLTSDSWIMDPSPGASGIYSYGGMLSATSTVDSAQVFYRLLKE